MIPAKKPATTVNAKLKKIKMVIFDVDGVLADGRIILDSKGIEYKSFDAHDGYGIARARELGMRFAIISGRASKAVTVRAQRLKIPDVYQATLDKVSAYLELKEKYGFTDDEVCYMGDDELDLPLMKRVGVAIAPANAMAPVKKAALFVTKRSGGRGAVREALDRILSAQSRLFPLPTRPIQTEQRRAK